MDIRQYHKAKVEGKDSDPAVVLSEKDGYVYHIPLSVYEDGLDEPSLVRCTDKRIFDKWYPECR